jgi:hypothetical protein
MTCAMALHCSVLRLKSIHLEFAIVSFLTNHEGISVFPQCLECWTGVRILPASHAVGGVSTEAIDRARFEAPARETNYIKVTVHDNMSTGAISRRAIARFQPTVNTEAFATVPAFSGAASP